MQEVKITWDNLRYTRIFCGVWWVSDVTLILVKAVDVTEALIMNAGLTSVSIESQCTAQLSSPLQILIHARPEIQRAPSNSSWNRHVDCIKQLPQTIYLYRVVQCTVLNACWWQISCFKYFRSVLTPGFFTNSSHVNKNSAENKNHPVSDSSASKSHN